MSLNNDEKEFQRQLRKEIEIPSVVTDRVQAAYRKIENHQVKQEKAHRGAAYWAKTGAKIAGGMAAVLAAAFVFCMFNPVMAKELPVVGNLFAQLQDNVSFFGNFADRATPLVDTTGDVEAADGEQAAEETAEGESSSAYTVKQDGLEISFSQVYANDQAIYLTMTAKSDEPFPDTYMGQTAMGTRPSIQLMTAHEYSFLSASDSAENRAYGNMVYPEGVFLDEHTFSCIMRLELAGEAWDNTEYDRQYDLMRQDVLNEMGVTEEQVKDETEEGNALLEQYLDKVWERTGALEVYRKKIDIPKTFTVHMYICQFMGYDADYHDSYVDGQDVDAGKYFYKGDWAFDIPVTVDSSQTEVLEINETNEAGIGLESVIKTPFELTVNDVYADGSGSDNFMVVLDANGNELPGNDSHGSYNNFTIQDRDISTVDIYILDYILYMDNKSPEKYNNNENKPEEEKWSTFLAANAKYHKTLHF
ncbi:MAG: DUF4179 domain-containing protein [Lachnospiraceae bacterium]|nr:DUF4179 domain-containing protein [Lachnospiraceae bacterium]